MSSSPAPDAGHEPSPVATALSSGAFLRVFARQSGDAVAAAGVIARAARAAGSGFQLRTTRETTVGDADAETDDERTVAVGWDAPDAIGLVPKSGPLAVQAADVVREAGLDPDPILALAGAFAAGVQPGTGGTGALIEAAERRDAVVERPGVAVPTADVADGLAHTTRLRLPISGDTDAATDFVADFGPDATDLDPEAHRDLASVVALDATAEAPVSAVPATERVLDPFVTPGGSFETLGGFAEVVDATARVDPGTAVALALDPGTVRGAGIDCWRDHAETVHAVLDAAETARYDGVFVVRADSIDPDTLGAEALDAEAGGTESEGDTIVGAFPTVARLARDFSSPEQTALAVGDHGTAVASTRDAPSAVETLSAVVAALAETETHTTHTTGTHELAEARADLDAEAVVSGVREVV